MKQYLSTLRRTFGSGFGEMNYSVVEPLHHGFTNKSSSSEKRCGFDT